MSNVSRGKQYEKECEAILTAKLYLVERAFNKTVFLGPGRIISVAHDFFGLWDIMARKKSGSFNDADMTLWVQVTTWESVAIRKRKIRESGARWDDGHNQSCLYARIRGRNGHFRVLWGEHDYEWHGQVEQLIKPISRPVKAKGEL